MPDETSKEYRIEINRYEERLINIRGEVDELEHQKRVLQNDIEARTNHLVYLNEKYEPLNQEIVRKEKTISSLDEIVVDKQSQVEKLQSEIAGLAETLQDTKQHVEQFEKIILSHKENIHKESMDIDQKRVQTNELNNKVEDRLRKLRTFLEEFN